MKKDNNKYLNILGFVLSSTSILTLLVDFYHIMPAYQFSKFIFVPSMIALAILTIFARIKKYTDFYKRTLIGFIAGFLATIAYDLIRIPFLFIGTNLYKAIFKFGPLVAQEIQEIAPNYVLDLIGWAYHFSNGITFGMMLLYILKKPKLWQAIVWGVILELAMLFTPYPQFFAIAISPTFIAGSFIGHLAYGIVLGLSTNKLWNKFLKKPYKKLC